MLLLVAVEQKLATDLTAKQKRVQHMVTGLSQLQELIHAEIRLNGVVRRLTLTRHVPEHGAHQQIQATQDALQAERSELVKHHPEFHEVGKLLEVTQRRSQEVRENTLALTIQHDHAETEDHLESEQNFSSTLAAEYAALSLIEDQMDQYARQAASQVNQLIGSVQARADRVRTWIWTLSILLIALVILGGIILNVVLVRMFGDVSRRQAETHRQNIELETLHAKEIDLRKTLDRERAMLKLILNTIPQGVYWKDQHSVVLGCNHGMSEMLGFEHPDQIIGTGGPEDGESFTEEQLSAYRHEDLKVMKTGQPRLDYEEHVRHTDGTTRTLLTNKVPLRDQDGQIIGVLGASIDITQRKQLEHQLVHAQKMESIGQLAAGIAHEINTPTQFVSENMRFLGEAIDKFQQVIAQQERFADPDAPAMDWAERHELLHDLKDEIEYDFIYDEAPRAVQESLDGLERIRDIVTAMREFSHPSENYTQRFNLNRVVQSSATMCRNRWKYVAELQYDLDPELPEIYGNAGELGQALVNLIVNAADALELSHPREAGRAATGRITIASRRTDAWVEVTVGDNGPGVPEDLIPRVFEPFFTTKDVGQGTGQGLSITHNVIVNKHKGQLELNNQPRNGAIFTIRLPLDRNQSQTAEAA
ncbi:MAG: ATP-binding protein [Planctomycetota bacterium]